MKQDKYIHDFREHSKVPIREYFSVTNFAFVPAFKLCSLLGKLNNGFFHRRYILSDGAQLVLVQITLIRNWCWLGMIASYFQCSSFTCMGLFINDILQN
jgi:hypothetical protein